MVDVWLHHRQRPVVVTMIPLHGPAALRVIRVLLTEIVVAPPNVVIFICAVVPIDGNCAINSLNVGTSMAVMSVST